LGMAIIIAAFLYWRYQSKPTNAEKYHRLMRDQDFVISKIRFFQEQNQKMKNAEHFISGLPAFSETEQDNNKMSKPKTYSPIIDLPPI